MRRNTPAAGAEVGWSDPKDPASKAEGAGGAVPLRTVTAGTGEAKNAVKKRVQFDFSEEANRRLEKLRERTQKQSQAEVVRNSLRVYEWLLDQLDQGYKLQLAKGDLVKEVEILL
jgi:hypothetical protein